MPMYGVAGHTGHFTLAIPSSSISSGTSASQTLPRPHEHHLSPPLLPTPAAHHCTKDDYRHPDKARMDRHPTRPGRRPEAAHGGPSVRGINTTTSDNPRARSADERQTAHISRTSSRKLTLDSGSSAVRLHHPTPTPSPRGGCLDSDVQSHSARSVPELGAQGGRRS